MNVQTNQPAQPARGALGFIFTVILLDVIGMSILFPVAAYVVREYSSSALMVSLLSVIYAAAQFLAAPVMGKLSDRYGRRPVLIISLLGSAVGFVMFGVGGALWVLFLSRLIDGITGGNISTASAYIVDITPPEKRAKNFGLIGIAFGLGFIIGPALGGALSQVSLSAPAYAAAALELLCALAGFLILPESLPVERRERGPFRLRDLNPFMTIAELLRRPLLGRLLLAQALFFFVFNGSNSILPVYLIDRFAALPLSIALISAAGGLVNVIVQGGLVGRLAPRFGEKKLAFTSMLLFIAGSLFLVVAPVFWLMYLVTAVTSVGNALFWPSMGALLTNNVSAEEQGKLSGVSTSLSGLTSVFGPLWAGAVFDQVAPVSPFLMGSVLVALASLVLIRVSIPAQAREAVTGD